MNNRDRIRILLHDIYIDIEIKSLKKRYIKIHKQKAKSNGLYLSKKKKPNEQTNK